MGKNNISCSCNAGFADGRGGIENATQYKLMINGELHKNNALFASNVAAINCQSVNGGFGLDPYFSYVTKSGDLYASGKGIGDGSNIPRKSPVLVFQNVINACFYNLGQWLLTSNGGLYTVDTKNTFKYELVMPNVYMFFKESKGFNENKGITCFTNNGSVYDIYYLNYAYDIGQKLMLEDVALPQIKD